MDKLKATGDKLGVDLKVRIVLPAFRKYPEGTNGRPPTLDFEILTALLEITVFTPPRQYDDIFIVNLAKESNALILSNDKYEDKQFMEDTELHSYKDLAAC